MSLKENLLEVRVSLRYFIENNRSLLGTILAVLTFPLWILFLPWFIISNLVNEDDAEWCRLHGYQHNGWDTRHSEVRKYKREVRMKEREEKRKIKEAKKALIRIQLKIKDS